MVVCLKPCSRERHPEVLQGEREDVWGQLQYNPGRALGVGRGAGWEALVLGDGMWGFIILSAADV